MKSSKPAAKSGHDSPNQSQTKQAGERIHKVLARLGLGSRRQIEAWIVDGKIKLNGKTAKVSDRLQSTDNLTLNGRRFDFHKRATQPTRILIYNKPAGEMVTRRDPQGRPIVFTRLPKLAIGRWIAVGRLDLNTEGLLLLTNNGELAHRLMHPSSRIDREYAVRIYGTVSNEMLQRLRSGVVLDGEPAKFEDIQAGGGEGSNRWFKVVVNEGRHRIVRRLWESQGVQVSRLLRVRYGLTLLPTHLRPRNFTELDQEQKAELMDSVGIQEDSSISQPHQHSKRNFSTKARRKKL